MSRSSPSSTGDFSTWNYTNWVTYGPDENCTLALCPVEASLYEYRPSLAASASFIALFGIALIIQIIQGVKYRTWPFMIAMLWGCVCEMIGYGGRIIMWQNPFSFPGFMVQIGECGFFYYCWARGAGGLDPRFVSEGLRGI